MQRHYVVDRETMYALDKRTMTEFSIPSRVLMELAGAQSAQRVAAKYGTDKKFIILCGHGNNGGDGFVIARWLINRGAVVEIIFLGDITKMSPETSANYLLCQKLECLTYTDNNYLSLFNQANIVIIDALLGIGFQGKLRGGVVTLIKHANNSDAPKIAIDIPSGVNANTGVSDSAFKADYTLTMAAIKQGMLLNSAPAYCGEVEIVDISIPDFYFPHNNRIGSLHNKLQYPHRFKHSHKGDYGKVVIIAGSPSYSGAAILSGKACVKSGAGLVKLLHPQGMETIFESNLIEVMTIGYDESLQIDELLKWAEVVLIGPGLGLSELAKQMVTNVLLSYDKTLVIDADALNLLATQKYLLKESRANILLTPHLGELSRLCDLPLLELKQDIVNHARNFAEKYLLSLLVKSSISFYIDQSSLFFIKAGNDGLSTGGSGDVLAGIITSFIAQRMKLQDAAVNGALYLGRIAELLSETTNTFSITPSALIENIGRVEIS